MRLSDLLCGVECEVFHRQKKLSEIEISGICSNSGLAQKDSLFVCIRGSVLNGIDYAKEAIQKGASAILAAKEEEEKLKEILKAYRDCTGILVKDERKVLALLSAEYEGYPQRKLKLIGVTGTKGKTTTVSMIWKILSEAGIKTGMIGTIEQYDGEKHIPSACTTPDAISLHKSFRRMADNGCKVCVMEVSSQALKLKRTYGIEYEIGVFLNLGKDHISALEHANMEEYMTCKRKLFLQSKTGIGNMDDPYYVQMFRDTPCRKKSLGIYRGDIQAEEIHTDQWFHGNPGVSFRADGVTYELPIPGRFTVYNALAAISVCRELGIAKEMIRRVLETFTVRGRMQFFDIPKGGKAVIDYAHNAMSLKSTLETLRAYHPQRLITVFGCGGNRDPARRTEMGKVSGILSDFTIITSDNPRWEEPETIMDEIEKGVEMANGVCLRIKDRKEAVFYAIEMAKEGDLIVIAGKGHETYQEIRGTKYKMDEQELVKEACTHKLL